LSNLTRNNIIEYIREKGATTYSLFNIPIYFREQFTSPIDLNDVIATIEGSVPEKFFYGIDAIIVGHIKEFDERNLNALLQDGAIYVSEQQDDEEDIVDDIIHEVAHNVENIYGDELYSDDKIEVEFLGKRKRLFHLLKSEYGEKINRWANMFLDVEYSAQFDEFLYKVVGYPKLTNITMGLFHDPYGTTSLREYFASGFEEYFLKGPDYLQTISPHLYTKIQRIIEKEKEI
jgi:hypothetical protein